MKKLFLSFFILFINFVYAKESLVINNIKLNGINDGNKGTLVIDTVENLKLDEDKKKLYFEYKNFENLFLYDNVRIFYTMQGEHALLPKFQVDLNKNLIPDFIEDVMTEAISTKILLDSYGFDLFSEKKSMYNAQNIKFLDIIISNSTKPRKRSAYFSGYRNNIRYTIIQKNNIKDGKSILMRVHQPGRRLKKSVPHEIFHAYQYSSTRLLNSWFTEASAVWFESALGKGVGKDKVLPKNLDDFNKSVLTKAYSANWFWNRITKLCSKSDKLNIPNKIDINSKYILDNDEKIFSDNYLYGLDFMQSMFDSLNIQNDIATEQLKSLYPDMDKYNWPKSLKKSKIKDRYMIIALKSTLENSCSEYKNNKELNQFVKLLDRYLEENPNENSKVSKVFENNLDIKIIKNSLDIKFSTDKKCKDDTTFARNIWDMKLFEDKIYLGIGNSRNKPPSCNAGPVPVIILNPITNQLEIADSRYIKEEKINRFLELGNFLMIPGHDPVQNWSFGNIYIKNKFDNKWVQKRTIPNTVHTYDIVYFDNKLFTANSIYENKKFKPSIGVSKDMADSWKNYDVQGYGSKIFDLIVLNNRMFSISKFYKDNIAVSEYINTQFKANKLFTKEFFFPDTKFENKSINIYKKLQLDLDKTIYIGQYFGRVQNPETLGLYLIQSKNKEIETKKLNTKNYRVIDLVKKNNQLYVLVDFYKDFIYTHKVLAFDINKLLNSPKEIISFKTRNMIRSFEVDKNKFYFGVGIELDNSDNYYPLSKKEDVGNILQITL